MIHYESLLQNAADIVTKCDTVLITKCNRNLSQNATVLLQTAAVVTKCDDFITKRNSNYKMRRGSTNINGSVVKSCNLQKLLGVAIESNFTFEKHFNSLCRKSNQNLHAFPRISQYLSPNYLFKTFVTS